MKDGWHTILGNSVYIEDGMILRGSKNNDSEPAIVYRWNKKTENWIFAGLITPAAFRAGIKRGTIILT